MATAGKYNNVYRQGLDMITHELNSLMHQYENINIYSVVTEGKKNNKQTKTPLPKITGCKEYRKSGQPENGQMNEAKAKTRMAQ